MATSSADEIKQKIFEEETQALREKLDSVDAKYHDFFIYFEKNAHLLEKDIQRQEIKVAEKEALLLQKVLLEDYLFSHAREILLERDHIVTQKNSLLSEKEMIIAEKEIMIDEINATQVSVIAEKNVIIHEKEELIAEKDGLISQLIAEKDELISQKEELIAEKDELISRSSKFFPLIGAAAAGVLIGIFFKQRSS